MIPRMKTVAFLWFLILFLLSDTILSHTHEEKYFEGLDDQAVSELLELLQNLRDHPLDLNRAAREDLQRIPSIDHQLSGYISRDLGFEHQLDSPFIRMIELSTYNISTRSASRFDIGSTQANRTAISEMNSFIIFMRNIICNMERSFPHTGLL